MKALKVKYSKRIWTLPQNIMRFMPDYNLTLLI